MFSLDDDDDHGDNVNSPDFPFDRDIHFKTPSPNDEQKKILKDFREKLESEGGDAYYSYKNWCSDGQLVRFLVARHYNLHAAYDLIMSALKWRSDRRPNEIEWKEGWDENISLECETGKICKLIILSWPT
jgi:hypothetical protein